jgi:hypothetical protein
LKNKANFKLTKMNINDYFAKVYGGKMRFRAAKKQSQFGGLWPEIYALGIRSE